MRDHWSTDDYDREDSHYRERSRRDRWQTSPVALDRRREADPGLRIKGTAKPDPRIDLSRTTDRGGKPSRTLVERRSSPPSQRQDHRERAEKRSARPSRGNLVDNHQGKHGADSRTEIERNNRSRELFSHKIERRRARSPVLPTDTDKVFRDRRDKVLTPPRSPRVDHHFTHGDSLNRPPLDSYVPFARNRRSRTPIRDEYRPTVRRRSRSRSKLGKFPRRDYSPSSARERSPRRPPIRNKRGLETGIHRRASLSRRASESRSPIGRRRKRSPEPVREKDPRTYKRRKLSRSPYDEDRAQAKAERMQQSTRPIQTIEDSRPSSPPRRTPNYGPEGQLPPNAFPMRAMHGGDHRRPPPPHVDTRHQYNTSPQWTPVSSHHGSPHSASPYGRGNWGGQTPQYHGQPPYVIQWGRCTSADC